MGPLLFSIYINDLPDAISSRVRLFADDCIVYREIKSPQDSDLLQTDIDSLSKWESTWQMSFNVSKCYSMRVSHKTKPFTRDYLMDGKILQSVKHQPYLGVVISNDLSWTHHINLTASKANKMLGLLRRNIYSCNSDIKETAYKALVCSKL